MKGTKAKGQRPKGQGDAGPSLESRRRLRALLWPLASGLWPLLAACGETGGTAERLNREANRAYNAGNYQAALETYQRANVERPDLTQINYNEGNTLHRMGQLSRAVSESQKAAAEGTNATRFRAYYALGNHYAKQVKWREAYESYRNALILSPSDLDAKYNLEVALRRLTQQQEQQEAARRQQQQQQGQGQQGQGQPQQGQGQPGDQDQQSQQGQAQGQAQQPGQGQPGQQNQQAGGPGQRGTPQTGAQGARTAAESEQDLKDALAGFERNVSIEDAMRILDVLLEQQRQRQQQVPVAPPGQRDQ